MEIQTDFWEQQDEIAQAGVRHGKVALGAGAMAVGTGIFAEGLPGSSGWADHLITGGATLAASGAIWYGMNKLIHSMIERYQHSQ